MRTRELREAVRVHLLQEGLALQLHRVAHGVHWLRSGRLRHERQRVTRCQHLLQLCQLQPRRHCRPAQTSAMDLGHGHSSLKAPRERWQTSSLKDLTYTLKAWSSIYTVLHSAC